MCDTCGCGSNSVGFSVHKVSGNHDSNTLNEHNHHHDHSHDSGHQHTHEHPHTHDHQGEGKRVLQLETDILSKNNLLAERNRGYFEAKKIKTFNLVSSPGSGKTSVLEKLIAKLKSQIKIYVIEGDQQTTNDAERIQTAGADAIQINTGNGCHLDAHMINHAVQQLEPQEKSVLFIENVGNLVCPALFDLGEQKRIVIISTTEGEDKPLKYPSMFQTSQICILNKIDLIPYLDFDEKKFEDNLHRVNRDMPIVRTSAKTGQGIDDLLNLII